MFLLHATNFGFPATHPIKKIFGRKAVNLKNNPTTMKEKIISSLQDPMQLELLFRSNNDQFKASFNELYPSMDKTGITEVWNIRLNYQTAEKITWGGRSEWLVVIILCLLASFVAKIPEFFAVDEEFFYIRNLSLIAFPFTMAYFIWKNRPSQKIILLLGMVLAIGAIYINLIPSGKEVTMSDPSRYKPYSDSFLLVCIHLPLLLWSALGLAYTGNAFRQNEARVSFLKFNADIIIVGNVVSLAFGLLTAITIGLFSAININIGEFYFEWIIIAAMASAPVVCAYIVQINPRLVNRITPIIARIFSPLVLITLLIYIPAIFISGKDPFHDRDFLLVFNLLLIGVMAIIFFAVSANDKDKPSGFANWVLLGLCIATIVVNAIALAAIAYRIVEWGFTPNRTAVLGGNVLILINMVLASIKVLGLVRGKAKREDVEYAITRYLPIYTAWTILVVFALPLIFHFK
jgi:hypothetical protein